MRDNIIDIKTSLSGLEKCHISPQTESYVCEAQELAVVTCWQEKHIMKNSDIDTCRVCGKETEITFHILTGCDTLAKKEYLDRHNNIAKYIYLKYVNILISKQKKWHLHQPTEVYMDDRVELVWDMVLTTDRAVGSNRPDIVIRDKKKKVYIIDISCPRDVNVKSKENEKITN